MSLTPPFRGDVPNVIVRPVERADWQQWLSLWSGYNVFYRRTPADEVTETTWNRFFDVHEPVHALVAERDEQLVGLTHYLFHRNTWMIRRVCYLQDLFTSPEVRGQGVGRSLIEAVYLAAGRESCERVYWLTHETNRQAMTLYDKVAARSGFIQYRKDLA